MSGIAVSTNGKKRKSADTILSYNFVPDFCSTIQGTKFCLQKRIFQGIFFDVVLFCLNAYKLEKEKNESKRKTCILFNIHMFTNIRISAFQKPFWKILTTKTKKSFCLKLKYTFSRIYIYIF